MPRRAICTPDFQRGRRVRTITFASAARPSNTPSRGKRRHGYHNKNDRSFLFLPKKAHHARRRGAGTVALHTLAVTLVVRSSTTRPRGDGGIVAVGAIADGQSLRSFLPGWQGREGGGEGGRGGGYTGVSATHRKSAKQAPPAVLSRIGAEDTLLEPFTCHIV